VDVHDIKIETIPRPNTESVGGARPEPEELPARRILDVSAPAKMSGTGEVVGLFKTYVTYETDVQTIAQGERNACHRCQFWDHALWANKLYHDWQLQPGRREEMNAWRGHLISSHLRDDARSLVQDADNDIDVEAALQSMGVCQALTEIYGKDPMVVTHPLSSCPEVDNKGQPAPNLFVDRDAKMARMGSALYDTVMRLAQGKK
jgi:hypothetical protein